MGILNSEREHNDVSAVKSYYDNMMVTWVMFFYDFTMSWYTGRLWTG